MKMNLKNLRFRCENIKIDDYIKARDLVKDRMQYPEWLGDFSKEQLVELLENGSKIWMYYLGNEFVCSMMLIPGTEKSVKKMGLMVDWLVVVDYGPMFVNFKYDLGYIFWYS